ncbi:MAG TPA: D-alanyl-D-alanine carboxypeptidase/D-alanyl-D-alanine-endopeptidase [Verrucomicrobiae bacterium]|nr:D-alanyl-D-alanine carboxypeptidase/D-alanyl-D-alanine-endopeptidase [Verrucomicrobiae bacterium]
MVKGVMARVFRCICIQLFLAASLLNAQPSSSPELLSARLDALLDASQFAHAQWGVKVVALDSGKTLFERNADKLMKPASNAKLYTAALALDRLGPEYRIRTSFYADAKPGADGIIHGDLIVYGRGDPTFSARFNGGDYQKAIQPAVDAIVGAGIKSVEGGLVGDESYFRGPPYGSDWTWDDLENYYGAPASALTFQDNVIDLVFNPGETVGAPCSIVTMPATTFVTFSNRTETSEAHGRASIRLYRPLDKNVAWVWGHVPHGSSGHTDSVPVNEPALWFVTMLKEALAEKGVAVSGGVRKMDWLDRETAPLDISKLTEVAFVESRPLAEIVKGTLKPSENLYAQLMLLQVGAKSGLTGDTQQAGVSELRKFLGGIGIGRDMEELDEGSGLSRSALVTPSATVKLLTFMNQHRSRAAYFDALPIGGIDGTLRNRFKGTPAQGNVHAKTGSLGGVDTLSGFMTNAAGVKLVFSIMLNNYREPDAEHNGRIEIDKVVNAIIRE